MIKKLRHTRSALSTLTFLMVMAMVGSMMISCSKTQSYSELLREEEKAVNWYLAQNRVELNIPEDSISFETGENAPFYRLDEDGNVYMQVISKGTLNANGKPENKVEAGDQVYFRYSRKNLKYMYEGLTSSWVGNSDNLLYPNSYFIYKNTTMNVSTSWGTGIQLPLRFFGYDCEVNLVMKSYSGFTSDQTDCIPVLINVRYFKPEY